MVQLYAASFGSSGDGKYHQQAGDQNGKEVKIQNYYSAPWKHIMRYKGDVSVCKQAAAVGAKLAQSPLVGYAWDNRESLYRELRKNDWDVDKFCSSGVNVDTDCSAFAYTVWCCVCPELRMGNNGINFIPATPKVDEIFLKSGMFEKITDGSILTSPGSWRIADVVTKDGHTVSVLSTDTDSPDGVTLSPVGDTGSGGGYGSVGGSTYGKELEINHGGKHEANKVTNLSKARTRFNGTEPKVDDQRKKDFDALANSMIEATPALGRSFSKSQEMYDTSILKGDQRSKETVR